MLVFLVSMIRETYAVMMGCACVFVMLSCFHNIKKGYSRVIILGVKVCHNERKKHNLVGGGQRP